MLSAAGQSLASPGPTLKHSVLIDSKQCHMSQTVRRKITAFHFGGKHSAMFYISFTRFLEARRGHLGIVLNLFQRGWHLQHNQSLFINLVCCHVEHSTVI